MIEISLYKRDGDIIGYKASGHAGFDERGHDVVCSAVSVLAINTGNAIDILTEDRFSLDYDDDGLVDLRVTGPISQKASVLLEAFEIGVKAISEEYGKDYIQIRIKEV